MFNWKETFTITMILFAVIDIIGSIPIIVDLRSKMGHIQSEKATIVAAIIMISFLFVGEEILNLIGIDANSRITSYNVCYTKLLRHLSFVFAFIHQGS